MQTYLFYDIETTGLNKAFDQVLQFAAIRTDLNLKEIERYELKIKLNPDVIPAPKALITHHIGISQTMQGLREIDAITQIHRWLNEPGTISLGYNTLGFDDEFLRFSFYRNLLPPYTHQYANQCSRMDIYPMTVMFYLFKNQVVTWPEKNGKTSLKLEEINHVNQLAAGRAHDAIVDVEVTIELAKRYFKEREMWDYLCGYFSKHKDQERLKNFVNSEALMVDGVFGKDQLYQCPALHLGTHQRYTNQTVWLKLDSEQLSQTTFENIKENTRTMQKKSGEPSFVLPLSNRFLRHLKPERMTLSETNKKWLQQNPDLFKNIVNYHINYTYPVIPETDIEASLYLNGFWSADEENFCRRFHAVNPKEKAAMTAQVKNPKLKALAMRILGRNYPEELTGELAESFAQYTRQINPVDESKSLVDFRGTKRMTPRTALNEIAEIRMHGGLTAEQAGLLVELETYIIGKYH